MGRCRGALDGRCRCFAVAALTGDAAWEVDAWVWYRDVRMAHLHTCATTAAVARDLEQRAAVKSAPACNPLRDLPCAQQLFYPSFEVVHLK